MNVQLKAPTAELLPVGRQLIEALPVQLTVMAELPAYPLPVAVTLAPTSPDVGERTRCDRTVNVALALFEGVALSVAVTVCAP